MAEKKFAPIHPGEILLEEFLIPLKINQSDLAKKINVSTKKISEIALCKQRIDVETALRLSKYFGLSERFWVNLQSRFDLETEKDKLGNRLETEIQECISVLD